MSDRVQDYIEIGILDLILDLCSKERWQPKRLKKRDIQLLTPVRDVHPPMHQPPLQFEDFILGEAEKPKIIYFPSSKEGTPIEWDGDQKSRFKAISDFNAYIKAYNERVDELWKQDGVDDLESQFGHPMKKYEDQQLSPYGFYCSVYPYRFYRGETKKDPYDLRFVENKKLWLIDYHTDPTSKEFVRIINKTIYAYIEAVTKRRPLEKGDVYYYPKKEFQNYAEQEGFDYEDIPNALHIETSDSLKKKSGEDSLLYRVVDGDSIPADFTITIGDDYKSLRFSRGTGKHTEMLSAKELGWRPTWLELIVRYGTYHKALAMKRDLDADWEWIENVKGDLKFRTVQKYQSELAKWFRDNLNMTKSPFLKAENPVDGALINDTFRFLIKLRFEADWSETKQYKSIRGKITTKDNL